MSHTTREGALRYAAARQTPIATVAESLHLALHRTGKTLVGPCPRCGGSDRLVIDPTRNRAFCRQCGTGNQAMSAIDLVSLTLRIDHISAVNWLCNDTCQTAHPTPPPATPSIMTDSARAESLSVMTTKTDKRYGALANAPYGADHRQYLLSRSIEPDTWKAFRMGVGTPHSVALPWLNSRGKLLGVKHRCIGEGQTRYWWERGVYPTGLYGGHLLQGRSILLIVEGEINAVSVWQECRDCVDVLSCGSDTATPPDPRHFMGYAQVLCWLDNEAKARHWASALHGQALYLPGVDANDLLMAGELAATIDRLCAPNPQSPPPPK